MQYTIEAILKGNDKVLEYFQKANEKWQELLASKKDAGVEDWAEWMGKQRAYFDKECGGHLLAPEVMPWSALGALYSTQFGWQPAEKALAEKFVKAVAASDVGEDAKAAAKEAARSYKLDGGKTGGGEGPVDI